MVRAPDTGSLPTLTRPASSLPCTVAYKACPAAAMTSEALPAAAGSCLVLAAQRRRYR